MAFQSDQVHWQPPAELRCYSGPRPVRLSGRGIGIVCVAAILFILGTTAGTIANRDIRSRIERDRILRQQGVEAIATVSRLWETSEKTPTPMVAYRFAAPGGEFSGRSEMRSDAWRSIRPGDALPVRYVPSNPEINRPAQGAVGPPPEWLAWMVPLMFLCAPILFWFVIRRQWRLLADGVPVEAVVTRITRSKKTSVRYEFRTPPGEIVKGRSAVCGRNVPEVGAHVCVLYNPDNPRKNSFYPMDMVKLRQG